MMTRKGERRDRRMLLRSQTTTERADNPPKKADVTKGNKEDIGGGVGPRGGVTLTAAVEGEVCAMAGKTRLEANRGALVTATVRRYHM
jgi:hypothetical protein